LVVVLIVLLIVLALAIGGLVLACILAPVRKADADLYEPYARPHGDQPTPPWAAARSANEALPREPIYVRGLGVIANATPPGDAA
jgi:hypothetical protein